MRAVFLGLLLVSPCLPAFADDAGKPASGPEPTSVVVSVKAGDSWGYEFRDGITNDQTTEPTTSKLRIGCALGATRSCSVLALRLASAMPDDEELTPARAEDLRACIA